MAEILGLGMSHFPGLSFVDEDMTNTLRRTLASKRVAEASKDPRNWPAGMQAEWADDQGAAAGRVHRERCHAATRVLRERLDAFNPDVVVVFGDDQYENFTEDVVPPFCVYAVDEMTSRPFDSDPTKPPARRNMWNEPADTVFRHAGSARIGRWLARALNDDGYPVPYAYRVRYERGLAHAFINTLLYLDVDRKGFPYPVLPFHVNCYGGDLIRSRGGLIPAVDAEGDRDPPAPSPRACYDMGRAVARAFRRSPWRVALVASSSWSHAFLTARTGWIYPDHESDRARLAELRDSRYAAWRELSGTQLEDAGQHELLNWVTVAGAADELGMKTEVVDWVECWTYNSDKCYAVFA